MARNTTNFMHLFLVLCTALKNLYIDFESANNNFFINILYFFADSNRFFNKIFQKQYTKIVFVPFKPIPIRSEQCGKHTF